MFAPNLLFINHFILNKYTTVISIIIQRQFIIFLVQYLVYRNSFKLNKCKVIIIHYYILIIVDIDCTISVITEWFKNV